MSGRKPHLIIFNPDQFRSDALAHLGGQGSMTPNLDQICRDDAVSFAQAYCQNPVCTPSRCSFMSGWYPHVHGHRTMYHMMHQHEPVLLRSLKQAGYHVWWGGKNDLVPGQHGYDDFCDHYNRTDRKLTGYNLHADTWWRGPADGDNYYSFYAGRLEPRRSGPYIDEDWAHVLDAIHLIESYDGDQPLCIYLPLLYPHPPYGVEEPYYSQIDRSQVQSPLPPYDNWNDKPSILRGLYEKQRLSGWSQDRLTELKATYLGMCSRIDDQFGQLVAALKQSGRYDDSAIFFFSDHGDFTGDYGLVEKTQNTFQDCLTRVPLIIKPPLDTGVSPGIRDALVELVDFPATVADLAGLELDWTHFGRSLVSLIQGTTDEHRDAVFCEGGRRPDEWHCSEYQSTSNDNNDGLYSPRLSLQTGSGPEHSLAVMLRTTRYKYVRRLNERDELYDLHQDPQEMRNLIEDPERQALLLTLKERMLQFLFETADVVPFQSDERSFRRE